MGDINDGDDRPTVLVVDDDPETADLYATFVADDYAVRTAYSGEAALDALDSDVAVVLLDRRMPGQSGDEVLRTIRDREADCRVVVVTALVPGVDVLDLPFDDYLVKPVARETVRDAVERMLVRDACDDAVREIAALVSSMATFESKMSIPELEASDEYAALEARWTELQEQVGFEGSETTDEVYAEFTTEKIQALFG